MLLIDGDILVYRCAQAAEIEWDWGDGIFTLASRFDDGVNMMLTQLERYREKFDDDDMILAFTSSRNFRKDLLPDYKGNRRGRKPLGYLRYRKYLDENYKTLEVEGLEADDVLGILMTKKGNEHATIISDDKDFKQIPGNLYRPSADELLTIGVEDGDRYHLHQSLVGDRVDNYGGCPGIGEVKARAILSAEGDPWDAVVRSYEQAGLTEADALVQARVARILRYDDFDHKKKEPILWTPK